MVGSPPALHQLDPDCSIYTRSQHREAQDTSPSGFFFINAERHSVFSFVLVKTNQWHSPDILCILPWQTTLACGIICINMQARLVWLWRIQGMHAVSPVCDTSRFVTNFLEVKTAMPGYTVAWRISAKCACRHNNFCSSYKPALIAQEHHLHVMHLS